MTCRQDKETDMTRFIPLAAITALMLALAGCGAEPAQESDATPEPSEVPATQTPAMVEPAPVAEETSTASDPAVATQKARPPEKARPKQEPAAKATVPPRAKVVPDAPKPVEPETDPHAGHDMDKM
jgi:hypothetical protein